MLSKQKQLDKAEALVIKLKSEIETEKNKVDFIIIDGWAYETKEHDFNKRLGEIPIPEGKELWLPSETWRFYEDKKLREQLNLSDCWFFVKQVRENTTEVARFCADSDGVYLDTGYNSGGSNSTLGVRFKWKVKGRVKK